MKQGLEDVSGLLELAVEADDEETFNEAVAELDALEEKLAQLEFRRMFSGEYDSADCYLDIQAGSGGTEAQDWASMLERMYLRWAESRGFKTEIIEESEGEVAGIKSVTIKISGDYAYGWLRTETGVHRLVRKSPFDSGGRRHTSFSSAFVYPEVDDDIDIEINPADLRIDVYRASGAGGQHVNRTESAVRITHIPTGIVTQCQNDRSQHKNKDQAMKQMKAKLYELEMQKKNAEKQAMEDNKSDIGWGSQIRSYVLDDSRIKDLRTGVETRLTVLGHVQRGGNATAMERVYASAMGYRAIELLEQGVGSRIVGVKANRIYDIDIDEALAMKKDINELYYKVAREISI